MTLKATLNEVFNIFNKRTIFRLPSCKPSLGSVKCGENYVVRSYHAHRLQIKELFRILQKNYLEFSDKELEFLEQRL